MATATQEEKDAKAAAAAKKEQEKAEKAAKDAEAKAKAEAKEAERVAKAAEREAAKVAKAQAQAEAKAKRERERVEKVLTDAKIDPAEHAEITLADARELAKKTKAEERANRPKKAPLTLSQRRAMLKLAESNQIPKSGFNALPLDHLVSVGLAVINEVLVDETYTDTEGEGDDARKVEKTRQVPKREYSLTDAGRARAGEVNPKWLTWKPDTAASTTETTDAPAEDAAA